MKLSNLLYTIISLAVAHSTLAQQASPSVDANKPKVTCSYRSGLSSSTGDSTTNLDYGAHVIFVDVPSVAATEDTEYTVAPVSVPLHHDPSLFSLNREYDTISFSVQHPFMHNYSWACYNNAGRDDFLRFSLINANTLDSSIIQFYYGEEFRIVGPGEVTFDFAYTKITPGHHEGWSWTWVPEKQATTIIHVPVKIVDNSAPTATSNDSTTLTDTTSADSSVNSADQ